MIGGATGVLGEESRTPPSQPSAQAPAERENPAKPELPFQIQLLETHIRFEANGDSRKDVHTIVKIINILGARQFARIAFDYNRSFQQIEIPLIRITHANGGTAEVLPSAVTDAPNPAVEPYPAYHDVRVKSARILGLQEGDTLEYRVITTTTHHPLAPDFWLEHSFDRSGQVLHENYELDLPVSRRVEMFISPVAPTTTQELVGKGESAHRLYTWNRTGNKTRGPEAEKTEPDVVLTTYETWDEFAALVGKSLIPSQAEVNQLSGKAQEIAKEKASSEDWIPVLYDFVSQQIKTVDVPLGSTGFRTRPCAAILSSRYGTPEDKFLLFAALAGTCCGVKAGLVHSTRAIPLGGLARPSVFDHLLAHAGSFSPGYWMDLNLEVAPFGMIPSQFRGQKALVVEPDNQIWWEVPDQMPAPSTQFVTVDVSLTKMGELSAKVRYVMRGDNELTLRMAFHQTPKERWKDVASLLAISDGFRGQITSVNASDPLETKDPFTVEYELTQPKFVDWSKKPVRIPALLPQIGLPDPPPTAAPSQPQPQIELGTPLEVQTTMTLHLPPGTTVETPPGTSVSRDYATFVSKYSATENTVTASRHINFLKRELAPDRATDYNAFLRAVQTDESQRLTLLTPEIEK